MFQEMACLLQKSIEVFITNLLSMHFIIQDLKKIRTTLMRSDFTENWELGWVMKFIFSLQAVI